MMSKQLPEKVREGLTWRRFRNALRSPSLVLRNLPFLWSDQVSESEHIFVMGPPRSGTMLVKNVLQSHSDICGVEGETRFFLRKNYVDFRHPDVPTETMQHLIQESWSDVELFDRFAEVVKENSRGTRFLEKTPEHALRMDYILDHFPESKVVLVVRDPRDGVRSARKHPVIWSTFPDEDRLGGYLGVWSSSVHAFFRHRHTTSVLLLRYEDFCRAPEDELKKVANHIGVEMQCQQLEPTSYGNTDVSQAESHRRLQKPITTESIGTWQEELAEEEVRRIEQTLADEMLALGYSVEYGEVA